jgi:hypothetical protein
MKTNVDQLIADLDLSLLWKAENPTETDSFAFIRRETQIIAKMLSQNTSHYTLEIEKYYTLVKG